MSHPRIAGHPDESGTYAPTFTTLDQRVLDAIPDGTARRLSAIVKAANRGLDQWSSNRTDDVEALRILRGLEHLGRVRYNRGWWRRDSGNNPKGNA
jgi:hypothetical protein